MASGSETTPETEAGAGALAVGAETGKGGGILTPDACMGMDVAAGTGALTGVPAPAGGADEETGPAPPAAAVAPEPASAWPCCCGCGRLLRLLPLAALRDDDE